jgi:hypothetical protein
MVIDKDTRQKSLSYSEITEEQRNVLQFALQSKKNGDNSCVVTNSVILSDILRGEGITAVSYEESGIPYG